MEQMPRLLATKKPEKNVGVVLADNPTVSEYDTKLFYVGGRARI